MKDLQFNLIMGWIFIIMHQLTGNTLFFVIAGIQFALVFIEGLVDFFSSSRKRKRK